MSDGVRIAFYIPSFERGGVERFVVNIATPLLDEGVAVDVVTARTDPFVEQLPDGVRVIELGGTPLVARLADWLFPAHVAAGIGSLIPYIRYVRAARPDMIVSLQVNPFGVFGARLARTGATLVVRESNTPSVATASPSHRIGRLAPLAKRLTYERADHVVAVSSDARSDLIEWLDLDPADVTAIYNPTFTDDIVEQARVPPDHPWFAESQPVVVSVGRFSEQKDFETLVRAFGTVHDETDARLLLVGDGERRSALEALVASEGLESVVDFVGYQENPYPYMAAGDLFVLSSHYEGLPNVLVEALALDTPVVSTDCPSGPREVLLDGAGGQLVPVGNVEAMAAAIVEALTESQRSRLERARDELDRFRPSQAAAAYLSLLDEGSSETASASPHE